MDTSIIGIIAIISLLVMLALGVHIGIALASLGFFGMCLISSWEQSIAMIASVYYSQTAVYGFTCIPLFTVMGDFAAASGITQKAFRFASSWLSQWKGGLYFVTTASCAMFAACTGSSAATSVAVGQLVIPEMLKRGYHEGLTAGAVAACGTIGILIPPSVIMVVYGILTEEHIGKLLLAGFPAGILTAAVYIIGMLVLVRIKKDIAPDPVTQVDWKERWSSVPGLYGVGIIFLIIIGGIYSGLFTPTEAGAAGAFSALVMALSTGKQALRKVWVGIRDAAGMTAMLFIIILGSLLFGRFLALAGVADMVTSTIFASNLSGYTVLMLYVLLMLIMGMFLSAMACIILVVPMAHAALSGFGFDGIWLGIITVKLTELACMTPPVAVNIFAVRAIMPQTPIAKMYKGVVPFIVFDLISMALLVAFPQISLFLPQLMSR